VPVARQTTFLNRGAPSVDASALARIRRTPLDATAWYEYLPGWVQGQEALLEHLVRTTRWRSERRHMYDRMVDVPRLIALLPEDGPGHPLLDEMRALLDARYGTSFVHVSMGLYRTGADSVAWHGDTRARDLPEALVATVSLGEPRRFLLRPRDGGRSVALQLGWGDVLVMGGSCQRTWRHAVPKVAHAEPRLAVMFRPTWYRG
jgi:alkylated DNA repair dioxygenase AlkB